MHSCLNSLDCSTQLACIVILLNIRIAYCNIRMSYCEWWSRQV